MAMAAAHESKPSEEEEQELIPSTSTADDAAAEPGEEGRASESGSGSGSDSEGNGKLGRGKLMQRHKRELKELHEKKEAEAKKLTSWAKAKRENQKIKVRAEKRDFEEKYRVLEQELQERQAKELLACGPAPSSESTGMASDADLHFLDAATAAMLANETSGTALATAEGGSASPSSAAITAAPTAAGAAAATAPAQAQATAAKIAGDESALEPGPQVPLTKKEKERLKKERFAEIQRQLREETH